MKIVIASVQSPFIVGGAERLASNLQDGVRESGHQVDIVTVPFRYGPHSEVHRSMNLWSSEDFSRFDANEVDVVICLKHPTYYLKHHRKVLWLLHQYRSVYDLWDYLERQGHQWTWRDRLLRRKISRMDKDHIQAIENRFTISANVSNRLLAYNGIKSKPLYHPPPLRPKSRSYEQFIFCPSRLEPLKRQSLLLDALSILQTDVRVVFAGSGSQTNYLKEKSSKLGLENKVEWLGEISDDQMNSLYSTCSAVFFGPYDEDYGYVTLEAMHAAKAVITCSDSGGPLEFVIDKETGFIVEPTAEGIAHVLEQIASGSVSAKQLGIAGRERYLELDLCWNKVVDTLLSQ
jgi:glycosyltransferase involved in cell wall biosynthesis